MAEHENALLLRRLFTSLEGRDHKTMADCYAPSATFRDIAFDLRDRREIHAMWRMICTTTPVKVTIERIEADDRSGRARIVDEYTFSETKLPVVNPIESRFRFENGPSSSIATSAMRGGGPIRRSAASRGGWPVASARSARGRRRASCGRTSSRRRRLAKGGSTRRHFSLPDGLRFDAPNRARSTN